MKNGQLTNGTEIYGTRAQFMELRRSRSPVFRCKDEFGGRLLIQRSPGRLTAIWFHKLRLKFAASPRNYESIPKLRNRNVICFQWAPVPEIMTFRHWRTPKPAACARASRGACHSSAIERLSHQPAEEPVTLCPRRSAFGTRQNALGHRPIRRWRTQP